MKLRSTWSDLKQCKKLTSAEEAERTDQRVDTRPRPRKIDIVEEFYLPRTTFRALGQGPSGDNRWFYYQRHYAELKQHEGKRVLNVCCGVTPFSMLLAHFGLDVDSFDVSPKAVEYVRAFNRLNGYDDRIRTDVMDASNLAYDANTFDIVTGEAALHHIITLDNALENIYRVLKPGGKAIFVEAFTFNPVINLLRNIKLIYRKNIGEHFLDARDIEYMESVFDRIVISDKAVFYTLSRFFRNPSWFARKFSRFLKRIDDFLLPRFPFLKKYFSLAYLELHKT